MTSELIELLHDARFRLENMGSTDATDADLIERIMAHVDSLKNRATPDVPELVRYRPATYREPCLGGMFNDKTGDYVRYDQAAAMIAAKDAEIKIWSLNSKGWAENYNSALERTEAAEAKLAQINGQKPVGHVNSQSVNYINWATVVKFLADGTPLYAAPVASEAETIERLRGIGARIIAAFDPDNDLDNPEKFIVYHDLQAALSGKEPS